MINASVILVNKLHHFALPIFIVHIFLWTIIFDNAKRHVLLTSLNQVLEED